MSLVCFATYSALGAFGLLALIVAIVFREHIEQHYRVIFRLASVMSQILLLLSIIELVCCPQQPKHPLPSTARIVIGAALFAIGICLEVKGTLDLGMLGSMGGVCSDELVTRGIYGVIRHPQNLGAMIWIMGIAFLLNSGYLALAHTAL